MHRLRVLTSLAATTVFMLGTPRAVQACDCVRLKPPSTDVRREAPVIFSGTVVEIVERNEHTTTTFDGGAKTSVRPLERRVVFRVTSGWQGVTQERFSVSAELSDCMFPFDVGRAYLVFAHLDAQARASTNICLRTRALDETADVLRLLGPPSYVARDAVRLK
jgi:hypothetical protein